MERTDAVCTVADFFRSKDDPAWEGEMTIRRERVLEVAGRSWTLAVSIWAVRNRILARVWMAPRLSSSEPRRLVTASELAVLEAIVAQIRALGFEGALEPTFEGAEGGFGRRLRAEELEETWRALDALATGSLPRPVPKCRGSLVAARDDRQKRGEGWRMA